MMGAYGFEAPPFSRHHSLILVSISSGRPKDPTDESDLAIRRYLIGMLDMEINEFIVSSERSDELYAP
jgi:hypothetical protein